MNTCIRTSLSSLVILVSATSATADDVRFGRDVLPILSANCFACHGPDESERKANLRLDIEADAKASHDNGIPIVPGNTEQSTLISRILSADPDLIMPPPDSHKQLKPEQIETLRKWIEQGAVWGKHWSFEPIQRPKLESSEQHPIDVLVGNRLKEKGLALQASAGPHQLARRVSLDLIGVPPTVERADAFAANPTEAEYEKLVDELLASPQFGEHWARLWMDLARYADTKGYEKDLGRTVWPYRDWLIRSINSDMPLDQMTIEQLAGDLLPNATQDQLVATAFHRNTMANDEGGTDDEEFRTIAVKDRVDTTMQVWMGLTAGCAKCHSHKYDPISQAEYYSLYAIFNQTQDADRFDDSPTLELSTAEIEAERRKIQERLASLRSQLSDAEAAAAKTEDPRWSFLKTVSAGSANGASLEIRDDFSILAKGDSPKEDVYTLQVTLKPGRHTVLRLEALTQPFADGQVGVGRNPRDPNFVLSELEVERTQDDGTAPSRVALTMARADYSQDGWAVEKALDGDQKTGWAVSPRQRERHAAMFAFSEPLVSDSELSLKITMRQHYGDSLVLRRFRFSTIDEEPGKVQFPEPSQDVRRLTDEIAAVNKELQDLNGRVPKVPVFRAMAADQLRATKIHRRGNFLDPGDAVTASVPSSFHRIEVEGPTDRLQFAKWLMSPENTLTARVWSNRVWARLFGLGIVETEEDFGSLGSLPSHPELLDWLAAEYRDNGWSLKKLLKTIVMSRTYRQTSDSSPKLREIDPRNVLLSRGARFRLSAETLRDEALAVSGLLSSKMFGPPVMPPQPDGLWRSTYNGQKWINAEGDDRYRRGLYTYLKRTTPYPSMTTFDGGSGEVCQIRRIRTNTPLQALVTLNDPAFMESAGALATKMVNEASADRERLKLGLRSALIRPVSDSEVDPLARLQKDLASRFAADPAASEQLTRASRAKRPEMMSPSEFASWIVVANTILNLDEFLVRN